MAILERVDDVWVVEFSGNELQKLDRLVGMRNTNRLEVLRHALNLCGAEQMSTTAVIQPPQVEF